MKLQVVCPEIYQEFCCSKNPLPIFISCSGPSTSAKQRNNKRWWDYWLTFSRFRYCFQTMGSCWSRSMYAVIWIWLTTQFLVQKIREVNMKIIRSFKKPSLMISKNYISVLKTYVINSKKRCYVEPRRSNKSCLAYLLDENKKSTFFCKYSIDLYDFSITTVIKNDTLNLPSTTSTTSEQVIIKNSRSKTEEKIC